MLISEKNKIKSKKNFQVQRKSFTTRNGSICQNIANSQDIYT